MFCKPASTYYQLVLSVESTYSYDGIIKQFTLYENNNYNMLFGEVKFKEIVTLKIASHLNEIQ